MWMAGQRKKASASFFQKEDSWLFIPGANGTISV
jgi:hypothetical protein